MHEVTNLEEATLDQQEPLVRRGNLLVQVHPVLCQHVVSTDGRAYRLWCVRPSIKVESVAHVMSVERSIAVSAF